MAIIPKGQEPERVKKRMETLFAKLDEAYPDKVISGLQKEHKKWAETVTELYRLLGYEDNKSFLEAYGYTYERKGGGRASNDYAAVIEELKTRYPDGSKFYKLGELQAANPDLAGKIKTLSNKSNELFGTTLADYLKSIGLLLQTESKIVEKEKQYHYLVVSVEGTDELVYCVTDTRSVHEDDFVEIENVQNGEKITGRVIKTYYYTFKKDLPVPIDEMNIFLKKVKRFGNVPLSDENAKKCIEILKERYLNKKRGELPRNVSTLSDENTDIPIRALNSYLRENMELKPEKFYIRNRILQGRETDLQEFVLCEVELGGYLGWCIFRGENVSQGDEILYSYDMTSKRLKRSQCTQCKALRVVKCIGLDAPVAISRISRVAIKNDNMLFDDECPFRQMSKKIKDIKTYPLAEYITPEEKTVLNFDETINGNTRYYLAQIRFKGTVLELIKLWKEMNIDIYHRPKCIYRGNGIGEMILKITEQQHLDAIHKFPSLKICGLIEDWKRYEVLAFYSESGARNITSIYSCSWFDPKFDGERWAYIVDKSGEPGSKFIDTRTGKRVSQEAILPWEMDDWSINEYYV